jgi:hypothetical protein
MMMVSYGLNGTGMTVHYVEYLQVWYRKEQGESKTSSELMQQRQFWKDHELDLE